MVTNSNKPKESNEPPERSLNEQRIREITLIYYSMPEVKKALFEFSQNRECIPRYFEGFGKRPDNFQYESDILEQVKKGATSFHCSEELWSDPLEISNELSRKDFDDLRIGWDLLIDVDSPYFEYSKIFTILLIKELKFHGVENVGLKFSGSKGFHLIIPWKAFPKEIYNQKTKNMFPEWARIICQYLSERIKKQLDEEIYEKFELGTSLKERAEKLGKKQEDLVIIECLSCNRPAVKKDLITWICPLCKNEITTPEGLYNSRRKPKCPDCRRELFEKSRKEFFLCEFCKIDSKKNPELFEKKYQRKEIEADLILVAPRHLFRMPYSLHEKTSLSSVVIDKENIDKFELKDAKPFKIQVKNYYPDIKAEEAKELLLQALEWHEQQEKKEKQMQEKKYSSSKTSSFSQLKQKTKPEDFKKIEIKNPSEDILPPCIKILLKGISGDGRKRALFILINFFKSLGLEDIEIEKRINSWNEKNSQPLKKGYIQSQISWHKRNKAVLPPNCDKPNYKDLAICKPDELCRQIKNPVNYAVKKYYKKH